MPLVDVKVHWTCEMFDSYSWILSIDSCLLETGTFKVNWKESLGLVEWDFYMLDVILMRICNFNLF